MTACSSKNSVQTHIGGGYQCRGGLERGMGLTKGGWAVRVNDSVGQVNAGLGYDGKD